MIDQTPRLSSTALSLLRNPGGLSKFRKAYGDYYVCGYELGADAGATLSATDKSSKKDETLALTVAVKVLFVEKSVTTTTTTTTMSSSSAMKFSGYSTLHHDTKSLTSESLSVAEQTGLQNAASTYLKKVASLDHDVRDALKDLGLKEGQTLPLSSCSELCKSGLVVQLLLAPLARLNDFVVSTRPLKVAD